MKSQLAESLGLSEKQISGWFCHRRLKDKRLLNEEPSAIGRQDRSSGIIQDGGSGFKQDSLGSTKLGEDRNFDTKEVESERLAGQEFSAADLTYEPVNHYTSNYNRINDPSSGGSSSLRNMSSHHNGDFFDVASSKYLTPKFPMDTKDVKVRPGPSGYLKVKGRAENAAIIAVKKQLGSHYRVDGPPLGIEFDPLPPGAFESSEQEPDNEPYCAGERVLQSIPDVSKIQKYPNFSEGYKYNYTGSHDAGMDGTNFRMTRESEISGSYLQQKLKMETSTLDLGINSPVHFPEASRKYMPDYESRDSYRKRPRHSIEVMRVESVSSPPLLQTNGGKVRGECTEPLFSKYNEVGPNVSRGGNIEYTPSNFTIKGNEYPSSEDKGMPRRTIKDAKVYRERITNEISELDGVVPPKNGMSNSKRVRDGFSQQLNRKKLSVIDTHPCPYQLPRSVAEIPSSFSEDDGGAEMSSMD
ncbi:homeobox-DDT domain RLT1-like isoform X1 [Olea europaea subsp. europaea]|uniref:Homeobox-DDT domain RLT1-like isoform X1 n=1 Tax=Olea europaea subsp. europaea TaxID=158383 RepID=A0A8S0SD37_OLEEU|nr:homeobox-DDT domain RLT1-like isoform X1 [Olea europaea subsp. europaea]